MLYILVAHGDVPFGEDQDAYLDAAQVIRDGGVWFDGQRNPLLSVVLAGFTSPGEAGVVQARLLVAAVTVVLTLAQMLLAQRLWGVGAAVLWGLLVGFNSTTLDHGSMIMVEGCLVGLVGLMLLTLVDCLRRDVGWWRPGLLLGLVLLAKGTAPVLVAAIVIGLVIAGEVRGTVNLLAVTALTYMPFLLYRWHVFGDPFYQVSHGLSWLDGYHPHQLEGIGFAEFVQTHGLRGLFTRLGNNMLPSLQTAVESLSVLTTGSGSTKLITVFLVVGGFILPGRRCIRLPDRRLVSVIVVMSLLFWAFCAWMRPIADVRRYWIPLVPVLALLAVGCWQRASQNALWWRRGSACLVVALLALVWRAPRPESFNTNWFGEPGASWRKDVRYQTYTEIRRVLENNGLTLGDRVLYGPGANLPRAWLWDLEREHVPWESRNDAKAIRLLLGSCRFWILDFSTINRNGEIFSAIVRTRSSEIFPQLRRIARIELTPDNLVDVWLNPLARGER